MMTVNLTILHELAKARMADLLRTAGVRTKEADR